MPLFLLALYSALMAAQLIWLAPSGRADDAEALLLSQALQLGYESKNPPLFYWLAHLVGKFTGPGLSAIYLLRMADFLAFHAGLLLLARRVQPDPLLALCAGLAMLASLHYHWYLFYFITNTGLATALVPWTLLAPVALRDRPTSWGYASFGALIAACLLSRYNFAIFAVALAIAIMVLPSWRRLFATRLALIALAVTLALILPHAVWFAARLPALGGQIGRQLGAAPEMTYAARLLAGAGNLAESSVNMLAFPLGLMLLVAFPHAFLPKTVADPMRRERLLLIRATLISCAALMGLWVASRRTGGGPAGRDAEARRPM